jgi:predicted metalloenzyme YecM
MEVNRQTQAIAQALGGKVEKYGWNLSQNLVKVRSIILFY